MGLIPTEQPLNLNIFKNSNQDMNQGPIWVRFMKKTKAKNLVLLYLYIASKFTRYSSVDLF
jgi:hypothetical protein